MTVAALILGLLAFVGVLRALDAVGVASRVLAVAQGAIVAMTDPDLPDSQKEKAVRRASIRLFGQFLRIAAIGMAAAAAATGVVWTGIALDLYSAARLGEVALGWPFLIGSSVGAIAIWIGLDRHGSGREVSGREVVQAGSQEVPYGALDRALHAYAFASPRRQRALGEIETRLHRRRIDPGRAARPVFVTSLPRAGTTVMLNALARLPELASATYRHMPFTLAPLLWGGLSGAFRKEGGTGERAHGDGVEVGFDSPEAFEEMVWMAFWPGHYEARRIRPWTARDRSPEFEAFFRTHMAKVVATKPGARRYLSKNNANIARLGLLEALFPDAAVVIPIRDPRAQVASLLHQHRRFVALHAREPFARQYMEGVGHFEFGAALKPIAFGGGAPDPAEADGPDFWLRCWTCAYEAVLAGMGPGALLVDHDALCADPEGHLPPLAEALGLAAPEALTRQAGGFRPPRSAPDLPGARPRLVARALDLHAELRRRAMPPARRKVPA